MIGRILKAGRRDDCFLSLHNNLRFYNYFADESSKQPLCEAVCATIITGKINWIQQLCDKT